MGEKYNDFEGCHHYVLKSFSNYLLQYYNYLLHTVIITKLLA